MAQRDRLPNWKIPLSIATVLHLVVFTSAAVFPDIGKKFKPDDVITIDLLSLPPGGPAFIAASAAGQQAAPRSKKQESAPRQPLPVEKVARNAAREQAEKPAEQPAPEIAEVAEPAPVLPVVTPIAPKKKSKVVPKTVLKPAPPPEPVAQVKSVSLHPLKRKKKLVEDIRLAVVKEQEEREKQQEQQKQRQELQQKQERERLAALEKEKAAEQERKLAARKKKQQADQRERKLAARKKKQQEAEKKKRMADQRRRSREVAEVARLARQAEQAAEQARLEAARARSEYASVAQAVSDLNTPLVSGDSGFSSGGYSEGYGGPSGRESGGGYGDYRGERVNPAVLNQYAASLNGRISSHWQLPEIVKAKLNLRTEVALTLRRDGAIEDIRFERKSGDSFFDQSVIKALRNSAPLPGFPALMHQRTQEFVLNFTPQGLTL